MINPTVNCTLTFLLLVHIENDEGNDRKSTSLDQGNAQTTEVTCDVLVFYKASRKNHFVSIKSKV